MKPLLPSWFLLVTLSCFWAGFIRMENAMKPLPLGLADYGREEAYGEASGEISGISLKNGSYVIITKNNRLFFGEEEYRLPCLVTYQKEIFLKNPEDLKIGMKVRFKGNLSLFSQPRNPGEFNYSLYYQSLKIKCRMFADELRITDQGYSPYLNGCAVFRQRCAGLLEKICAEEDYGLLKAILLGDKSDLEDEIRQLYQKNGIAHLLAVSGLHISLIGMGAYRLLRKFGLSFGMAGLACSCLAVSYGVVTGSGSSAVRAVIMLLCYFLAQYLGRTYDMVTGAGAAGLLLLWDSPFLLFQSGFQLSFTAVLAIGAAGKILSKWLGSGRVSENMAVSLSIQLITFPVILYHFFQFPVYGIFLNFLVLPLIGMAAVSGMAGMGAGAFFVKAGVFAVGPAHYILAFYQLLCHWFERLPGYTAILGRPDRKQLAAYYILVLGFLLWVHIWGGPGNRRAATEGREEIRGGCASCKRWIMLAAVCLTGFVIMLPVREEGLLVTFLDVGQGDGIWMEADGYNILVDGGSSQVKNVGKYRIEPFLKSRGISRIDYAFVSHGDSDHINGLEYLLGECTDMEVKNLVLPVAGKGEEVYERLSGLARQKGGKVWYLKAGDRWSQGKLNMECLHPEKDFSASNRNNQSEVLFVTYGDGVEKFKMLLTGDVEEQGEAAMEDSQLLRPVHLLKAAHHGSDTSSGEKFLSRLSPRWCVISYGEGNSYGHPKQEVVERLKQMGTEIRTTAQSGAVTVRTDGKTVKITGYIEENEP